MAIDIVCEKCKLELTVGDSHGGKKGRCPRCGAIMRIPMPGAAGQAGQPAPQRPPAAPPQRPAAPPAGMPQQKKTGSSSAIAVGSGSDESVRPYTPPGQTPPQGLPSQRPGTGPVAPPPQPPPPQRPGTGPVAPPPQQPRPGTGPVAPPPQPARPDTQHFPPPGPGVQTPVSSGEFSPVTKAGAPPPQPAPAGQGTGMYCQDCNREITVTEPFNKVGGDILCTACHDVRFGLGAQTGDPVLDAIGLNIPGLVVLKGRQEREIGRLMQDASAKEEHKRVERKQQQKSGEVNCEIPIAKLLAKAGLLQRETYIEMKKFQRQYSTSIFDALIKFNVGEPAQLAQLMSENSGIPFLQHEELPVDFGSTQNLFAKETMQMYLVIPLSKQGETLNLAVVNPYDRDAIEDVEKMTGLEISPVICTYPAFMAAYEKFFNV